MSVWITRSQPGADRLAAELERHGVEVLVAPVLDIEPIPVTFPESDFEVVVFLSEHAVTSSTGNISLRTSSVLAVGARTGKTLADRGISATVPSLHSSEGLLECPELTNVRNKRILLVAGEAGRQLLAEDLTRRGAKVHELPVYRRLAVENLSAEKSRQLRDVEMIAIASGDGFVNAARLWFAAGRNADVRVLVPSARVAFKGESLGFANVHDCAGSDTDAVLRGITRSMAGK